MIQNNDDELAEGVSAFNVETSGFIDPVHPYDVGTCVTNIILRQPVFLIQFRYHDGTELQDLEVLSHDRRIGPAPVMMGVVDDHRAEEDLSVRPPGARLLWGLRAAGRPVRSVSGRQAVSRAATWRSRRRIPLETPPPDRASRCSAPSS